MDGRLDREGCEDGEEPCDLCCRTGRMSMGSGSQRGAPRTALLASEEVEEEDRGRGQAGSLSYEGEEEGLAAAAEAEEGWALAASGDNEGRGQWVRAEEDAAWAAGEARELCRQDTREAEGLEFALLFWRDNCVVCWVLFPEGEYEPHRYCGGTHDSIRRRRDAIDGCRGGYRVDLDYMRTDVRQWVEAIRSLLPGAQGSQTEGGGFEQFGGCFHCGVPQQICTRWEPEDADGGRMALVPGRGCAYAGVLEEVLGFCIAAKRHLDDEI